MQYIVLGMHRSGTSMITRLLNMMGATVGDTEDLGRPAKDNEKGFWERWEVAHLNNRLLAAAGGAWDDVHDIDFERVSGREKEQIEKHVAEIVFKLDVQRPWVLKDPRFSLTLPWWQPHLESPVYIFAIRHPLEVARSLQRRNSLPVSVGLSLWEFYNRSVRTNLQAIQGHRSLVIDYASILNSPAKAVADLYKALDKLGGTGLRLPSAEEVEAFVSGSMNHHADHGAEPGVTEERLDELVAQYRTMAGYQFSGAPSDPPPLTGASKVALELQHLACQKKREAESLANSVRVATEQVTTLKQQLAEAREAASPIRMLREEMHAFREESAGEQARLRQTLSDELAKNISRANEFEAAKKHLQELLDWVDEIRRLHDATFKSMRWRLGNGICRFLEFITFRGRAKLAADDLKKIDTDIAMWRQADASGLGLADGGSVYPAEAVGSGDPANDRKTVWGSFLAMLVSSGVNVAKWLVHGVISLLPVPKLRKEALRQRMFELQEAIMLRLPSRAALEDITVLAQRRYDPISTNGLTQKLPNIDLSVVLYQSEAHIRRFLQGLEQLDYPLGKLRLLVTDHTPGGEGARQFEVAVEALRDSLGGVEVDVQPNRGFGAGHNSNLQKAQSPIFLVCNIDGSLTRDSLKALSHSMANSPADTAAWEMRQSPYEHPKYYDPVTLETSWVSAACAAYRTSALRDVRGFDSKIFMYGEDVELSYRLRSRGWRLRYVPRAVFFHDTYAEAGEFKPRQFLGSTLANMYIRLRYGRLSDIASMPAMWLGLGATARRHRQLGGYLRNSLSLLLRAPYFLATRKHGVRVPFAGWDYGMRRDGAFEAVSERAYDGSWRGPLVSIVVRTYGKRQEMLRQALRSIANQTYQNIEVLVVEDGGDQSADLCRQMAEQTGMTVRHFGLEKVGRCVSGNRGLQESKGELVCFLDDDDLFFADHVELLACKLTERTDIDAAYALAWESAVVTDDDGRQREVMHRTVPLHREKFSRQKLSRCNLMPIQAVLFRRQLYEACGGLDPDLEILEDWDLWRRFSHEHAFMHVGKTTSIYHVPADVSDVARRQIVLDEYYQIAREKFERYRQSRQVAGNA